MLYYPSSLVIHICYCFVLHLFTYWMHLTFAQSIPPSSSICLYSVSYGIFHECTSLRLHTLRRNVATYLTWDRAIKQPKSFSLMKNWTFSLLIYHIMKDNSYTLLSLLTLNPYMLLFCSSFIHLLETSYICSIDSFEL